MEARFEIPRSGGQPGFVELNGTRFTLGRHGVDIVVAHETVSRLHASVEQVTGGWVLQDLGSRNGTFVNGDRVLGPRALRPADEVRLGSAMLLFRAGSVVGDSGAPATAPLAPPPDVSRRERDLLVALCRPLLASNVLAEPASVRAMAEELVVSESAIKKLLARSYDRFGLHDHERRRGRLAVEALNRGVVMVHDAATTCPAL